MQIKKYKWALIVTFAGCAILALSVHSKLVANTIDCIKVSAYDSCSERVLESVIYDSVSMLCLDICLTVALLYVWHKLKSKIGDLESLYVRKFFYFMAFITFILFVLFLVNIVMVTRQSIGELAKLDMTNQFLLALVRVCLIYYYLLLSIERTSDTFLIYDDEGNFIIAKVISPERQCPSTNSTFHESIQDS